VFVIKTYVMIKRMALSSPVILLHTAFWLLKRPTVNIDFFNLKKHLILLWKWRNQTYGF